MLTRVSIKKMISMKIYMQAVNFNAQETLEAYVEEKIGKLDTYSDQIVAANVYLKLDNSNSKENKIAEVILEVPGDDIVVSKTGQSFEECIDLSADTLKRLIIKRKEKLAKK